MNAARSFPGAGRLLFTCLALAGGVASAWAAGGSVRGRIFNRSTGEYVENARVTIEGTAREAMTDALGEYRLADVPAGEVRVRVFFTGLEPAVAAVRVGEGAAVAQDFSLARADAGGAGAGGGVVRLERFEVQGAREIDGAAIAIQEKRFAADIRNVIAADEFGPMADGNVGELLKHVPGVALDYVGGAAMNIALNGVPPGYVPVTMNGFALASTTASSPTGRDTELVNVATNNLARIEVLHSPTPEQPGNALGGAVNMVPRGAFERAKPLLQLNAYVLMRDDAVTLGKSPGPTTGTTRRVLPGFDFSYVAPVNRRWGFTLSGGTSEQYQPTYFVQTNWRGVSAPTNGGTFPTTTVDRPYLTDYLIRDQPRLSRRSSAGLTVDVKLTPADRISLSLQATQFDAHYNQRDLTFAITRVLPGNFALDHTHGAPGAGTLTLANVNDRQRRNTSFSPSLTYRHDGPVWRLEAGAGLSFSESTIRDQGKGFFNSVTATRTGVTIDFDEIFYLRPGRITVRDGAGAPVDPYRLSGYTITTAGGNRYGADTVLGTGPGEGINNRSTDTQRNASASARRHFTVAGVPLTLKAGLDVRQARRDYRGGATAYTYLGPDGRANSGDEGAGPFLDPVYSAREGVFGFPRTERIGGGLLHDFLRRSPQAFTKNDNTIYRSAVNLSKVAQETVSSAYLRGDVAPAERRLKLTTGVRVEQTNIAAEGPLTDPTRNYQRRTDGTIVRGANGQPLPIVPATDALGVSRLTFVDRGARAEKEYLTWLPSLNASWSFSEQLIGRVSLHRSIGRPNYNQYAGGLTLPDEGLPPSPNNRITMSNAAVKPWTADNVKVALEYYFQHVGLISAGAFRRNVTDFFGATVSPATPEFLALYDLDPQVYGAYDVATQFNVGSTVRMEGYEVSYKQALGFLPRWARGVQVFANGAIQRVTGEEADNFANFIPKTASWGVSWTRERGSVRVNWNYKSKHRRAAVTGVGIEPGTYAWGSKRLFVDVIAELKLTRNLALFGNIRNLRDTPEDFYREGPNTPEVAQFRQRDRYGALWICGVKGTF